GAVADSLRAGTGWNARAPVPTQGGPEAGEVVVTAMLPTSAAEVRLGKIPAGRAREITIPTVVDPSMTGAFVTHVSVRSSTAEARPGDEAASDETTVTPLVIGASPENPPPVVQTGMPGITSVRRFGFHLHPTILEL